MPEVLVIGAGPAGLSCAAELAHRGIRVRVAERDEEAGGVPRHSNHAGYGLRDLRRVLTGPAYARRLRHLAVEAGARIDVRTTVTALRPLGDGSVEADLTSPAGRECITVDAVVLATGCRERPRTARLVPGTRPAGVLTTGWLQRLVHLEHRSPGQRAVVVGAEHVSYSAVMTLAEAGCRTLAMVTERPAHTSFAAFDAAARMRYRFPLLTRTRVSAIHGRASVTGVTVTHDDGRSASIACDTVVFTGDWLPEAELATRAGIECDPATRGPCVDARWRTTAPGVFAAGNLLHPASTADVCAHDGVRAAESVADMLDGSPWPRTVVPLEVDAPLLWASPGLVVPGVAGRIRLQTSESVDRPRLTMTQGDRTLWSGRVPWIRPTRPFGISGAGLAHADAGGPVRIRVD